jgi:hypothetical protein
MHGTTSRTPLWHACARFRGRSQTLECCNGNRWNQQEDIGKRPGKQRKWISRCFPRLLGSMLKSRAYSPRKMWSGSPSGRMCFAPDRMLITAPPLLHPRSAGEGLRKAGAGKRKLQADRLKLIIGNRECLTRTQESKTALAVVPGPKLTRRATNRCSGVAINTGANI